MEVMEKRVDLDRLEHLVHQASLVHEDKLD